MSYTVLKNKMKGLVPEGGLLWHILVIPLRLRIHSIRYPLRLLRSIPDYFEIQKLHHEKVSAQRLKKNHLGIVITSAGRGELLKTTIANLRKYVEYPDEKLSWFIIDDWPASQETRDYINALEGFTVKLLNAKNKGLGYSLNRIYAEVDTEFVFHCEEDWEILRPIPIQEIMRILRENTNLAQLLLKREPYKEHEYVGVQPTKDGYAVYDRIFGFQPHIARTEVFLRHRPFPLNFTEMEYTFKVKRNGYVSGIFGYGEKPYVRHLAIPGKEDAMWSVKIVK